MWQTRNKNNHTACDDFQQLNSFIYFFVNSDVACINICKLMREDIAKKKKKIRKCSHRALSICEIFFPYIKNMHLLQCARDYIKIDL